MATRNTTGKRRRYYYEDDPMPQQFPQQLPQQFPQQFPQPFPQQMQQQMPQQAPQPAETKSYNVPLQILGPLLTIFITVGGAWLAVNKQITEIQTSYNLTSSKSIEDRNAIMESFKELKNDLATKTTEANGKAEFNIAQLKKEISNLQSKVENLSSSVDDIYDSQMKMLNNNHNSNSNSNSSRSR